MLYLRWHQPFRNSLLKGALRYLLCKGASGDKLSKQNCWTGLCFNSMFKMWKYRPRHVLMYRWLWPWRSQGYRVLYLQGGWSSLLCWKQSWRTYRSFMLLLWAVWPFWFGVHKIEWGHLWSSSILPHLQREGSFPKTMPQEGQGKVEEEVLDCSQKEKLQANTNWLHIKQSARRMAFATSCRSEQPAVRMGVATIGWDI